jgi:hypothetical protein
VVREITGGTAYGGVKVEGGEEVLGDKTLKPWSDYKRIEKKYRHPRNSRTGRFEKLNIFSTIEIYSH